VTRRSGIHSLTIHSRCGVGRPIHSVGLTGCRSDASDDDVFELGAHAGDVIGGRRVRRGIAHRGDQILRGEHCLAGMRQVDDRPGIVEGVADRDRALRKLHQVACPAGRSKRLVLFEVAAEGHRIGLFAALDQDPHGSVDALVHGQGEVRRAQHAGDPGIGRVGNQQRTQQSLLGAGVARRFIRGCRDWVGVAAQRRDGWRLVTIAGGMTGAVGAAHRTPPR